MLCLQSCEGCPFGGAKVGGKGNPAASIVVVGESPGQHEVRLGAPFVGPTGNILDNSLIRAGIPKERLLEDVYYTNAIHCYPGYTEDKNPETLKQATHLCHQRLQRELDAHPRKVIIALGNPALWSTT